MYLEAVFRFYVLLNHFVGHFFFGLVRFGSFSNTIYRNLALALSKLHINVDITVGFFVGQKNYRLHMARHRELVNPSDFLYFIPQLPKHLHISCQRCGIAGYIHDAVRLHAGHGVEEVFFAAFSRRIDNDDVRVGVFARMVFASGTISTP